MGLLCRLIFQAILFLPISSFGQYAQLEDKYIHQAKDPSAFSQLQYCAPDTIFFNDHYVYGLSDAFNYILSEQYQEGFILKTDTIQTQQNVKPKAGRKDQKGQLIEQSADEPLFPCTFYYKEKPKTIYVLDENLLLKNPRFQFNEKA